MSTSIRSVIKKYSIRASEDLTSLPGYRKMFEYIKDEIQRGHSGHWDMDFQMYIEERMGDLDFLGRLGDPEDDTAFEKAYDQFIKDLKRVPGLAANHARNRRG